MATPDWKAGTGYPPPGASVDVWEHEFLIRGEQGLKGRPHFKLPEGGVEFFEGPAIIQISDDGSLPAGACDYRTSATHTVIEFMLDQELDAQIERAKRWLTVNQRHRFTGDKQRKREAKFGLYLRALDANKAGASLDEIAHVLYPELDNTYPSKAGAKLANKHLVAARKLAQRGLRAPMNRR